MIHKKGKILQEKNRQANYATYMINVEKTL